MKTKLSVDWIEFDNAKIPASTRKLIVQTVGWVREAAADPSVLNEELFAIRMVNIYLAGQLRGVTNIQSSLGHQISKIGK